MGYEKAALTETLLAPWMAGGTVSKREEGWEIRSVFD
jgi:hypothetical protein